MRERERECVCESEIEGERERASLLEYIKANQNIAPPPTQCPKEIGKAVSHEGRAIKMEKQGNT